MIDQLTRHEMWQEYLIYKTEKRLLSSWEEQKLREFVEERKYLSASQRILDGEFRFSVPEKKELNKLGSSKKRVVYCFPEEENMILKMLSYLLYRYDGAISSNCYSFRKGTGARKAFADMTKIEGIEELWGFKADISNYFNSIDVMLLLPVLQKVISDDPQLLQLLTDLLQDDRAFWQGEIIREPRGVMAGTPTSPFFANLYLKEMDEYFAGQKVHYARYSDDIILFGKQEEVKAGMEAYRYFIEKYRLTSNPAKEQCFVPGGRWTFLGFDYEKGVIDVSDIAVRKLMDKIRRSARSIRRWMIKKEASPERALRAFNRKFNRKFFESETGRELCWSRWYFPVINTEKSLHFIDRYMQDWQRYIVTGKHNKANYRKVSYDMLVENGYRPLVSAYYEEIHKKNKKRMKNESDTI